MTTDKTQDMGRRRFLGAAGLLAAAPLVGTTHAHASTRAALNGNVSPQTLGRRKLGTLEVSSVGLGVQNMSRTYQMMIPTRSEMLNIIRTAYDHGVTFFDAAEAYCPLEVERILGEGIAPFRDKVVITQSSAGTSIW